MANTNNLGSNSSLKSLFSGTIMDGAAYEYDCIDKRINEIAKNAAGALEGVKKDIQKSERTIKFLDEKNIKAIHSFADMLDGVISLSKKSHSITGKHVKDTLNKLLLKGSLTVKKIEAEYKAITKGKTMSAKDFGIAATKIKDKDMKSAVEDYSYYLANKNNINKASFGKVIGADDYIKAYRKRVFDGFSESVYTKSSYKNYRDGILSDFAEIAGAVAEKLKAAATAGEVDSVRVTALSSQLGSFMSSNPTTGALGGYMKRVSSINNEGIGGNFRPYAIPSANTINWASFEEQRVYIWNALKRYFSDNSFDSNDFAYKSGRDSGNRYILNEWQIAGIMGNIALESRFSPSNANNKFTKNARLDSLDDDFWMSDYKYNKKAKESYDYAYGLMQWKKIRQDHLYVFAKERAKINRETVDKNGNVSDSIILQYMSDMDTQLAFLYHELTAYDGLKDIDLFWHGDKYDPDYNKTYYPERFSIFIDDTNEDTSSKNAVEYIHACTDIFSNLLIGHSSSNSRRNNAIEALLLFGSKDARDKLLASLEKLEYRGNLEAKCTELLDHLNVSSVAQLKEMYGGW